MNIEPTIITTFITSLLQLIFAVIGVLLTGTVIPWLVKSGIPWLKEKRLYALVKKFVEAAEKQAESGFIEKGRKKQAVIDLLEAKGITVTPEIDAYIEAAVKELDIATNVLVGELAEVFTGELDTTEENDT